MDLKNQLETFKTFSAGFEEEQKTQILEDIFGKPNISNEDKLLIAQTSVKVAELISEEASVEEDKLLMSEIFLVQTDDDVPVRNFKRNYLLRVAKEDSNELILGSVICTIADLMRAGVLNKTTLKDSLDIRKTYLDDLYSDYIIHKTVLNAVPKSTDSTVDEQKYSEGGDASIGKEAPRVVSKEETGYSQNVVDFIKEVIDKDGESLDSELNITYRANIDDTFVTRQTTQEIVVKLPEDKKELHLLGGEDIYLQTLKKGSTVIVRVE